MEAAIGFYPLSVSLPLSPVSKTVFYLHGNFSEAEILVGLFLTRTHARTHAIFCRCKKKPIGKKGIFGRVFPLLEFSFSLVRRKGEKFFSFSLSFPFLFFSPGKKVSDMWGRERRRNSLTGRHWKSPISKGFSLLLPPLPLKPPHVEKRENFTIPGRLGLVTKKTRISIGSPRIYPEKVLEYRVLTLSFPTGRPRLSLGLPYRLIIIRTQENGTNLRASERTWITSAIVAWIKKGLFLWLSKGAVVGTWRNIRHLPWPSFFRSPQARVDESTRDGDERQRNWFRLRKYTFGRTSQWEMYFRLNILSSFNPSRICCPEARSCVVAWKKRRSLLRQSNQECKVRKNASFICMKGLLLSVCACVCSREPQVFPLSLSVSLSLSLSLLPFLSLSLQERHAE